MKESTSLAGQETIHQQVEKCSEDLAALDSSMHKSSERLQECVERWQAYQARKTEIESGIQQAREGYQQGAQPQVDLPAKQDQLRKFKVLSFKSHGVYNVVNTTPSNNILGLLNDEF